MYPDLDQEWVLRTIASLFAFSCIHWQGVQAIDSVYIPCNPRPIFPSFSGRSPLWDVVHRRVVTDCSSLSFLVYCVRHCVLSCQTVMRDLLLCPLRPFPV